MAKIGDLSVNIGIEVSEETVQRCCQLLQLYLEDNPNKIVESRWDKGYDGEFPCVWISERSTENVDKT